MVKRAFQAARYWGVQPSEFWAMAIRDWWWEYAARDEESRELRRMADTPAKFRGPKWDEARKRHAEKMRAKNGASGKPSG